MTHLPAIVVVLFAIIFLFYPPPQLSSRLNEWKLKGSFYQIWNNKQIFVINEEGRGISGTVICLHGFPTSSYDWVKILPDLKEDFSQIVMLDFLGFGFSDKPTDHTYTIAEQADIVEYIAHLIDVKNAHVLSHDYGDTVALELLARHNMKRSKFNLLSLVMLNGGIFPETHYPRLMQKILQWPVVGYIASHVFFYRAFCTGLGEVFGQMKPTENDFEDFWAVLRYNYGDNVSYRVINFLEERQKFKTRWAGALQATQVKVLMIYGPADPVNPHEFRVHFQRTLPRHAFVTLNPSVGHYPQWEDPATVGRELRKFISKLSSPT